MSKKKTVSGAVLKQSILLIFVLAIPLSGLLLIPPIIEFQKHIDEYKNEYFIEAKKDTKKQIEQAINRLTFDNQQINTRMKSMLQEQVSIAHAIASELYEQNKNSVSDKRLQSIVRETLRKIRYNNGRGYFFATGLDGIEQLFTDRPELEGKKLLGIQDSNGKYVIRDMIEIAKSEAGEGFYSYTWSKPGAEGKSFPKLSFIKYFKPFDWFIGTGEYLDVVETEIKAEAVKWLDHVKYGKDNYLFAFEYGGTYVAHVGQNVDQNSDNNYWDLKDVNGVLINQELQQVAKQGGGFVEYVWHKPSTGKATRKLAYVEAFEPWGWVIGTGIYLDDIESAIEAKQTIFRETTKRNLLLIGIVLIVALGFAFLIATLFSRHLSKEFATFQRYFKKAIKKSGKIEVEFLQYDGFQSLARAGNQILEDRDKAEAQSLAMIEANPDFIFRINKNNRFTFIHTKNPEELLVSKDMAIGKTCAELLPPDLAKQTEEKIASVIQTGQIDEYDYSVDYNGETSYYEARMAPCGSDEVMAVVRDITDRKNTEKKLRESEATIRNKLKEITEPDGDIGTLELLDIVDVDVLKSIMDEFYQLTDMPGALVDLSGKVLVAVGWQDICTKFHRVHPETCKNCFESDTILSNGVPFGTSKVYQCKNNLWDMVTPLYVGGRHVGNVFIGQFFYEDEVPDIELFRDQARKYGFDEEAYIEALQQVPRFSHKKVETCMQFYSKIARIISTLSYSTIQQSRMLTDAKIKDQELEKAHERIRLANESAKLGIWDLDLVDNHLTWDDRMFQMYGISPDEFTGAYEAWQKGVHPDDVERASLEVEKAISSGEPFNSEFRVVWPDGQVRYLKASATVIQDESGQAVRMIGINFDVTEMKQDEDALRRMQFAIDSASVATYWIEPNANFLYVNDAACNALGYTKSELLTMNVHDIGPEFPTEVWPAHWKDLQERKSFTILTTHLTKNGHIFPVEINVNYVEFDDKEYNVAFATDITERMKTEEALRESEERYRRLTENAADLIWRINPDGQVLYVNSTVTQMLGYSVKEALEMTMEQYFSPASVISSEKAADEALASDPVRTNYQTEFEYRHKDGHYVPCEANVTIIMGENGQPLYFEGISRDITERKKADEKIHLQALVLDQISDHVAITDLNGVLTYVNQAQERIFHRNGKELIGRTTEAYGEDPKHGATQKEILEKTLKDGSWHGEVVNKKPDGTSVVMNCRTEVIADKNDEPLCLVGISTDITEKKKTEKAKKQLEFQLQQAQKMESVGRLAGGVAHDFNNLLTGITGNIQLAQMDLGTDDPIYETLGEINDAADRAADLTRQLLAFSRKQIIEPKVINLNDLIKNMYKMLGRIIGEDIEIKFTPTKRLGQIKADPGQVEQIITNLSVNARDAMPNGGKLTIETTNVSLDEDYCNLHPHVKQGEYVRLVVSDNGEGMDQETQNNIFDPFFTTKEEGQGTGLGLATVYGIVKQHDGHIEVYSEIGEGTTFKVYFPLIREKAEAITRTSPLKDLPHGTETVFIVEDESMVRNIAIKILTRLGYKVMSADDGTHALATIHDKAVSIDLLLTDIVMPKMNGRELAEKLQKEYPEMKVLFSSGYTEDVIAHHGVLEEGLSFIGKPYTPQALAKKVREVLDG